MTSFIRLYSPISYLMSLDHIIAIDSFNTAECLNHLYIKNLFRDLIIGHSNPFK